MPLSSPTQRSFSGVLTKQHVVRHLAHVYPLLATLGCPRSNGSTSTSGSAYVNSAAALEAAREADACLPEGLYEACLKTGRTPNVGEVKMIYSTKVIYIYKYIVEVISNASPECSRDRRNRVSSIAFLCPPSPVSGIACPFAAFSCEQSNPTMERK